MTITVVLDDLPNIESMSYQWEDATSSVVVDDEIIYIIENDDEDIDDVQSWWYIHWVRW